MSTATKVVLMCCGVYVLTGIGYSAGLLLTLPFGISLVLIAMLILAWMFFCKDCLFTYAGKQKDPNGNFHTAIVFAAVTATACILVKAHGAYDAWMQWNSLAKYMSSDASFRYLHLEHSIWHADYPPGLPAPVGLAWRLIERDTEVLPRSIGFLFYLGIPVLLCSIAARVCSIPYLWLLVLGVFTLNYECVSQGLNEYADVPLALLLLLSFITIDHYLNTGKRQVLIAAGLMLGGCMLMKNEGIMLALCVLLVYGALLFRTRSLPWLLYGLLPSIAVLILYKRYIPSRNDILDQPGPDMLLGFVDWDRYLVIAINAARFIVLRFPVATLFVLWGLYRLRGTALWKSRGFVSIALCFSGFLVVYLTTRYSARWLVPTTLNRVFMQLLPSAVYFLVISLDRHAPTRPERPGGAEPLPSLL